MSKEKLSAEEWLKENDPDYYITSNKQVRLMEAYAQYKTEQLQREKEELLKFAQSVAMFESWAIHRTKEGR